MNRIVTTAVVTGVIAFFMTACGSKEKTENTPKETATTEQTEEKWEPEKVSDDTTKASCEHEGHDHDDHSGHTH